MRIVIGYDDSECARATLEDLEFAGIPRDAEALVLAVVDALLPPEGERSDEVLPRLGGIRAEIRDSLRSHYDLAARAAEQLRARFPGWTVHAESCADSPSWAIVKRAEGIEGGVGGEPADLVVVGSRGRSGLQRLVLGSVSTTVLSNARCSVRIARPRATATGTPRGRAPAIVIGVDGSPDARAAVDAVAERTWPGGTRVLVAAFEKGAGPGPETAVPPGSPGPVGQAWSSARSWAEGAAAEAAERLRSAGLNVETVVEPGDPRHGLVDRARAFGEGGADCIFVGARGRRRIERFLLGSVSMSVAMNARCSVEVVRPRER